MSDAPITLHVNGRAHSFDVDVETPLIHVLRQDLGLLGVRPGCSIGVCGACTVIADGAAIRSCDTPLSAVQGAEIVTPEELGSPEQPHPVQQAFLDEQAAQCGYCINGMIMSTAAAAARGERAGEAVPEWLTEHICRCCSHHRIRRAVSRALGDEPAPPTHRVVRLDGSAPSAGEYDDGAAEAVGRPVEAWVRLLPDGEVAVCSGRVEYGQGIRTALLQIAAAHLGLPADRVRLLPTATGDAPDEGVTSGSNSVDHGGAAIAAAAVAFGRLLRERAGELLDAEPDRLAVGVDGVTGPDGEAATFAELAKLGPLTGCIEASDRPDWRLAPIGDALARDDLRPKLTGSAAYVHDLALPGMRYARAVLPPALGSVLEHIDTAAAERLPGVVKVVHDDRLVIVVAEREEQAVRAVTRLQRDISWRTPDAGVDAAGIHDHLRAQEGDPYVAAEASDVPPEEEITHRASYALPYQAHASIAPSCAVAQQDDGVLRVHSHTQGIYPLQRALAGLFALDPADVEVVHMDGAGAYGHNLADDAAAFAAVAARALPGEPVRFQFSVEDEFAWEPLGPAMAADLAGSLTDDGRIAYWAHTAYTDVHSTRPAGDPARLMPAWLRASRLEPEWPGAREGGGRNARPLYNIPAVDAVSNHVRGPLRTSAFRTLGAYLNTFAAESFVDELAEKAGRDPLAFRLDHLADARARRVLESVADAIGWEPHVGPSGRGVGLAVARYKTVKAYVAAAIEASIDTETAEITVRRMILACDAGTVINPDGLANQIEGGALQGLSRALHEEMRFDSGGAVTTRDWLSYPVIGFGEIPAIEVILVDGRGQPPLGAGEASVGPPAAALANAIDDAIGVRLRALPLTPERVLDRLYSMEEDEAARVLLH